MIRTLNQPIESMLTEFWGTSDETIIHILVVSILIIFFWFLWGFILRRLKDKISPELFNALRTLGRATILLLGLFWIVGEELFIGAAALLGTAIGFASSTTLGNFISGLYLLVTNPFNVGDYIMIPSLKIEGIVEEVSINYTKILTPNGIHVSISNQKLLGAAIHNTKICVPQEVIDKGKITWRDHEGDKFDSYEDIVDILKGIRAKYSLEIKEYYLYPLVFSLSSDKYSHALTKQVFNEAIKKFSDQTEEEISWLLIDRSNYQINLIVSNPYVLFDLKSNVLGFLEEKIEEIHKK
ncbi:MAG: mechanosensitive ion channel family protein [Candidatus Hodarchaeota archaeon]